jgi:hypothetical protein
MFSLTSFGPFPGALSRSLGSQSPGYAQVRCTFLRMVEAHHSQPYVRSPRRALLVNHVRLRLLLLHRGHLMPDGSGTPHPVI